MRIPKKAILAQQRIPKVDEVTANLTVVLWRREYGDYCTHLRNDDDGAFIDGHYGMSMPAAWVDFSHRVVTTWPTIAGVPVDEDATIESVRKARGE